jgi:hypothetical protein
MLRSRQAARCRAPTRCRLCACAALRSRRRLHCCDCARRAALFRTLRRDIPSRDDDYWQPDRRQWGLWIERSETGEPGEFEGMNETELANYISQKMVELGIEIVREEESELSALSST